MDEDEKIYYKISELYKMNEYGIIIAYILINYGMHIPYKVTSKVDIDESKHVYGTFILEMK